MYGALAILQMCGGWRTTLQEGLPFYLLCAWVLGIGHRLGLCLLILGSSSVLYFYTVKMVFKSHLIPNFE